MRRRVEANRPWAKVMGSSRAVRVGSVVEVSGTAAAGPDGTVLSPGDVEGQTRAALATIGEALEELGASFRDVVRTRILLADASRWDDIDRQRTPTLWNEASKGSIGWLSVKSADRTTCPADGWLTLGAGNYAAYDTVRVTGACPPLAPELTQPDGIGANLTRQHGIVQENQDDLPYGAVPGASSVISDIGESALY